MGKSPKLKALKQQIESGKIITDAAKILNSIINNHRTIKSIIPDTGIKESTIVARLSDLEDLGVITKSGTLKYNSIEYTIWEYEPDPIKQNININKVQIRKYLQWRSRGLKLYRNLMTGNLITELEYPMVTITL